MGSKLTKIEFCFPKFFGENKKLFVEALVCCVQLNKEIGYAGFAQKKDLRAYLINTLHNSDIQTYVSLSITKKNLCRKIMQKIMKRCFRVLPPSSLPIHIFVFPLLGPFGAYDKKMGFTHGYCPYRNTVHVYVSPQHFSRHSLQYSVAHEYNHAVYFSHHSEKQTVGEAMVFEGLAENFEEEIIGKGPAPYAMALNRNKARKIFRFIKPSVLDAKDRRLYEHVFFGGKKYKKWTGYSIGYWIVKSFRKKHPDLSWQTMIQKSPKEMLEKSGFIKK